MYYIYGRHGPGHPILIESTDSMIRQYSLYDEVYYA